RAAPTGWAHFPPERTGNIRRRGSAAVLAPAVLWRLLPGGGRATWPARHIGHTSRGAPTSATLGRPCPRTLGANPRRDARATPLGCGTGSAAQHQSPSGTFRRDDPCHDRRFVALPAFEGPARRRSAWGAAVDRGCRS